MHVTHVKHQADFNAGRDEALEEISNMGFDAALKKWRMDNPQGAKFSSMAAYYYTKGGMQALVEKTPNVFLL